MTGRSEKKPNPHEVSIGKYLRGLARPVGPGYWMRHDGSVLRLGSPRPGRKAEQRERRQKVIAEVVPRRSWADVQAAWRRRVEARR